jgi:PAS domain-containing protein
MTTSTELHRLDQPVPADLLNHLGWFRFYFDDDRWDWSAQLEQMYGYPPGSTAPSTPLLLSHVHPHDYQRVAATVRDVRRTREAFSSRHRILDVHDQVHDVVMTGAPLHDLRGAPVGMQGLCVDLSEAAAPVDQRRYEHTTNQFRLLSADKRYPMERRERIRAATHC